MRTRVVALCLVMASASCGQRRGPDEPGVVDAGSPAGVDVVTSATDLATPPPPPPQPEDASPPGTTAPETIVLAAGSKQGKVSFGHLGHESRAACADCHHETADGGEARACRSCHAKGASLDAKKAFHAQCIGCHKERAAGPASCAGCHSK